MQQQWNTINNKEGYERNGNLGLRDKIDGGSGLISSNPNIPQFTNLENIVIIDTRDCLGEQSLIDSQIYANIIGKRGPASGLISNITGVGVVPTVITTSDTTGLIIGDEIKISKVSGNSSINGNHSITAVTPTTFTISSGTKSNYIGGGLWNRKADSGYPVKKIDNSFVYNNTISITLEKPIKSIKDISLYHIVIPRDIIPITSYFKNFIDVSTTTTNIDYGITQSNYITYIPQEVKYTTGQTLGFYSTPLSIFRSYIGTSFSLPDQVTPPPHELWNPPIGVWPLQPVSYPFQTVPTYVSNEFTIGTDNFHIVLSGYGVYDLVDWTIDTGDIVNDPINTNNIRKLLLMLIARKQSYNDVDYIDLIKNSTLITSGDTITTAFGFGDFQRYVPGPGIGQNYQPGTSTTYNNGGLGSGPPNVVQLDSPIPFPNFKGNVWGPYNAPGDRFQKIGTLSVIQDLFLNGDLDNLNGNPIIFNNVPTERITSHPFYGLNFSSIIEVNLGNIGNSNNFNILNAMRIIPNGFGASTVRANGSGVTYTNIYENAGGQGPSSLGVPNSWVNNGVYSAVAGVGSFVDPIAKGYASAQLGPENIDASIDGTGAVPLYRTSYTDSGTNNGYLISSVFKYINYIVNEVPDTDLIIRISEVLRDERSQSTNYINSDAILDCPIRLNIGSTSGTIQYIESLQSLVGNASGYWNKRYLDTKSELTKLNINLFTYQGDKIPVEKMLNIRSASFFINLYNRFISELGLPISGTVFDDFVFNPMDPKLDGRVKRYFQIIFKINSYNGMPPGLEPNSFRNI